MTQVAFSLFPKIIYQMSKVVESVFEGSSLLMFKYSIIRNNDIKDSNAGYFNHLNLYGPNLFNHVIYSKSEYYIYLDRFIIIKIDHYRATMA